MKVSRLLIKAVSIKHNNEALSQKATQIPNSKYFQKTTEKQWSSHALPPTYKTPPT